MGKKGSSSKIYQQEQSQVSDKLKKQTSSSSSFNGGICCMRFLQCVIFVIIILLLLTPLILELGKDEVIVYLDQKNETNQNEKVNYVNLYNEIKQKRYIKIMIDEQQQTSAVQQIRSSIKRSKTDRYQSLTIRNYSDPCIQYRYALKKVKKFISQNIFIHFESFLSSDKPVNEQKVNNTWVLIGQDSEIPINDVEQIKQQLPDDGIVIITNKQSTKYQQFILLQATKLIEQSVIEQPVEVIEQKQIKISQQQKLQELIRQIKVLTQKISQKYEQISKNQQERLQAQKQRNIGQQQRQKSQQNRVQSLKIYEKKRLDQQKQRMYLDQSLKSVIQELKNKLSTTQQIKQNLDQILANQQILINTHEQNEKSIEKETKGKKKEQKLQPVKKGSKGEQKKKVLNE